jgi:hypothetical protein
MKHVQKMCNVKGCTNEATYWIAASAIGNSRSEPSPAPFYLCLEHQYQLDGKDEHEGGYLHLRFDTGELRWLEIGKYACSPECAVCNR